MAQCQGKTKSGARCKRNANVGSEHCPHHLDQAGDETGSDTGRDTSVRGPVRGPTDLLLVGAVALALLALRRVIRL